MSPLKASIAFFSSPRQSLSRGPWFLRISGFSTKDFRSDGEKGMLHQAKNPRYKKRGNITTILWLARMMGEKYVAFISYYCDCLILANI